MHTIFGTRRRATAKVAAVLGTVAVVTLAGCGAKPSPLSQASSETTPVSSSTSDASSGPESSPASSSASDSASGPASDSASGLTPSAAVTPSASRTKPAASSSAGKRSRPATGGTAASRASLKKACTAVNAVFNDFIQEDFKHPNDPKGASKVFISSAARLRKAGAGTPIEKETNQLATTMQRMGRDLASGADDGNDTTTLGKAIAPLRKVCGPVMK